MYVAQWYMCSIAKMMTGVHILGTEYNVIIPKFLLELYNIWLLTCIEFALR